MQQSPPRPQSVDAAIMADLASSRETDRPRSPRSAFCVGSSDSRSRRAWLVARPLARLLLTQLGLALAAVLLIGVS